MRFEVSSQEFSEGDQLREHLTGLDLEVTQLSKGPLQLRWDQIAFADMVIGYHRVGGSFADRAAVGGAGKFLVICLAPTATVWCGLELAPGHILVMAPGREYRSRIAHWESLEVFVADSLIEGVGLLGEAPLPRVTSPESSILPLDDRHVAAFRVLGRSLLSPFRAEAPLTRFDVLAAELVRERTLELLQSALALTGEAGAAIRRVPRYDLAERSMAFVDGNAGEPITLARIAGALDTTPRAIQYAFRSALGVSPYQYLMAHRLQRARRELLVGQGIRAPVTAAALEHGFDNLSRFALQYQRLFGEAPSATVRRARDVLHDHL